MDTQTVDLLKSQMDGAWQSLLSWLASLTDQEFHWELIPGCWTVRTDKKGRWILDYAIPEPNPPPLTTIAWRLVHIATCKVMYWEHAFGPEKLTWDTIEIPHTVAETIAMLNEGHLRLRQALDGLDDSGLEELRPTNWGDRWPTWRIFWVMIAHDLEHGAEIGCLRDLYRATQAQKKRQGTETSSHI